MTQDDPTAADGDDCVVVDHPVPPEHLARYSVDRDPHSEMDIANYVGGQAPDESVLHVEKVKREVVLGSAHDVWDVTTDKGRWWVITNPTNLYSQQHFQSLDFTLSFHVGLMMRLRSREEGVDSENPTPFDEVFRRVDQAEERHDTAVESEAYQSVGMQLRESLISLVGALRRRTPLPAGIELPKDADFVAWSGVLMDSLCRCSSNKQLRQHLKTIAKETWHLVNWLTHARNADKTASSIAIQACRTTVGHFIQVLERDRRDHRGSCPTCKSRDVRTHFDIGIGSDGDYYVSCGVCDWTDHPGSG